MYNRIPNNVWIILGWALLLGVALACRPLFPVDETRYVSAAWEMWARGNFLVPHLNGETYSHKPPLLFWLIQLGWWLFGVNEWWPRMVSPLFGLINVFLAAHLARRVWPEAPGTARLVPLILAGSLAWALYTTVTMFDMLVGFFTLIGAMGLWHSRTQGGIKGWLLMGVAIGGGVLAKGPVILLHLLPLALLAPWWGGANSRQTGWRWYGGVLGAVVLGAAIALAWAIPAAISGGPEYRDAIFWGQSAGRVVHSFAHRQPWWWYLPLLPLMLFPWSLWSSFWQSLKRKAMALDSGERFCLAWLIPVLILFSAVSGKQVHYIIPDMSAFALLAASRLSRSYGNTLPGRPLWGPAIGTVLFGILLLTLPTLAKKHDGLAELATMSPFWGITIIVLGIILTRWRPTSLENAGKGLAATAVAWIITLHISALALIGPNYNLHPMAEQLAQLQAQGKPIAHVGKYFAEYQFLGRLTQPLTVVDSPEELRQWNLDHRDGYVVIHYEPDDKTTENAARFSQDYRSERVALISSEALLKLPQR